MPASDAILDVLDDYIDFKIDYDREKDDVRERRWYEYMGDRRREIVTRLDEALAEYVTKHIEARP